MFFPIVSLRELMTPEVGPFLTPGAWLAGFIKKATIHCYTHTLLHTNLSKLWALRFRRRFFFVNPMTPPKRGCVDPRGMVGKIHKVGLYTLLHTKYESSGPCGLKKIFCFGFCFSNCKSMGANDPRGRAIFDPRGMVGRIYKDDHYTLLHTKYASSGPCDFGKYFFCFSHDAPGAGPVWTPGARLAGFIKRTLIHRYTQNRKALGLVVLEKKIFFMVFPL